MTTPLKQADIQVIGKTSIAGVENRVEDMLKTLKWDNNQGCWFDTEKTNQKKYGESDNFNNKTSTNATTVVADSPCTHNGCVEIPFKIGDKGSRIFACSSYVADVHYPGKDLVLSFNNEDRIAPVNLNAHAARLLPKAKFPQLYTESVPMVTLKWHDFDVPPVDFGFFQDIVRAMESKKLDVLIYCMAGHGRTGTGLGALLTAAGFRIRNPEQPNVVKWIRENYCQRAIETGMQIEWLKDAGADVGAETGSKSVSYSYGVY